ncbi:MAG: PQQ-dependent sugar dehydrogenase [Flavobacteriales bacterium]|jgi:glucose/arabinose dehydrogenase|nr:PQQ-dependent sugar dehydrogenase [Flavobacteriales bacterium]MBK7941196.1 PQQ-dependent sugar dehydrogenase [Flavobacteriales bacterium]MBK8948728.1 PQQ-dependent sugar dehydrogenase [Flavobacteriales bacterium]MBK9701224.1 PQQ-dependent sugar dehydrogenase [Flavobacteriales bacterium]
MSPRGTGTLVVICSGWLLFGGVCAPTIRSGPPELARIKLPEGFGIGVFAEGVTNARAMCWGDRGTLFVGSRAEGVVHALTDTDRDGQADIHRIIARDLRMPAGVAFRKGSLYVSAVDRILRYDSIEDRLEDPPAPIVLPQMFPAEDHHGWKFIAFGPDDRLYVPVGAPCNNCLSEDSLFATITSMTADGKDLRIEAHGVRNTVGFDWRPGTGELWFTDNGRDWMGDDAPDCELDRLDTRGLHFGYPYCHAGDVPDPEYGDQRPCSSFTAPAARLGAHVAPLGMCFLTGTSFPPKYRGAILIAEHGSWNRSTPVGYRVVAAFPRPDGTARTEVFADGWLDGSSAWGRPVDVLEAPDGSVLISDDATDRIYRVSYNDP